MKSKFLVNLVIACIGLFACRKSAVEPPPSTEHKIVIEIYDNYFRPDSVVISKGDTILWFNRGSNSHTSTSGTNCNADGRWDSGLLSNGQSFGKVFDSSGTFHYFCRPHCSMGMKGVIIVQ